MSTLPALLVPPSWLRDRLSDSAIRVVDLREPDDFADGHIPGAVNLQLEDLADPASELDNTLLDPDAFAALMAEKGISRGDAVVAYDDNWGLAAARLVWALHRYGHSEAAILDGGWDRWQDEDGPVETGPAKVTPASYAAPEETSRRDDLHADAAWIAGRIDSGGAVLLDTRSAAEYVAGHLPGARSWDWFKAVPADTWNVSRDAEELHSEWRDLGFDARDEVVVYCRSGMRAAHTWVVLRAAGFERVRLYDGSWQDWSNRLENLDD